MTEIKSDASLKGKIRQIAKEHGLKSQEVLQMYLFEHLLMRLEKSAFADKFVLKGGLLIAAMTGVFQRTTMDMDTTVIGMDMDKETVSAAINEICGIEVGDGMAYRFVRIEPIREDDEYANWRAHINVRYGKINAPIKIDITTGDALLPGAISYPYPLMFEQGTLEVLSYHLATVVAEKLETVVSRGTANTRGRDYYDLYLLNHIAADQLNPDELREALQSTCEKRGSADMLSNWKNVLKEVRSSDSMHKVWESYLKDTPYAAGIDFAQTMDAASSILELAGITASP